MIIFVLAVSHAAAKLFTVMRAGGQFLPKKEEPNHQRIEATDFAISNRGSLISLVAFVNPIHENNEKERW